MEHIPRSRIAGSHMHAHTHAHNACLPSRGPTSQFTKVVVLPSLATKASSYIFAHTLDIKGFVLGLFLIRHLPNGGEIVQLPAETRRGR